MNPGIMDTLGVSEKETSAGQGGRWRGARFDTNSEQGKKDWDDIMKALGIPRNKGATYENRKYKEVILGLSSALNTGEVKITKKA